MLPPSLGHVRRGLNRARAVFEALASFDYKTVEFALYTQGASGPITTPEIRALSTSSV